MTVEPYNFLARGYFVVLPCLVALHQSVPALVDDGAAFLVSEPEAIDEA